MVWLKKLWNQICSQSLCSMLLIVFIMIIQAKKHELFSSLHFFIPLLFWLRFHLLKGETEITSLKARVVNLATGYLKVPTKLILRHMQSVHVCKKFAIILSNDWITFSNLGQNLSVQMKHMSHSLCTQFQVCHSMQTLPILISV